MEDHVLGSFPLGNGHRAYARTNETKGFPGKGTISLKMFNLNYDPSARTQTVFFFALWKEASWRRHLEGGIWEASGRLSEALWELALWGALWELGRPWGLQGHLGQKMLQIHIVLQQKYKNKYNFA